MDVVGSPSYRTVSGLKERLGDVVGILEDCVGVEPVKEQVQMLAEIVSDMLDLFGYSNDH